MATPGEMVHAVAEVLGVPEATVIVHDRNLLIAGLRTKGGRGRSAPQVTARDVANLLIGVAASTVIKDTAETVRRYSPLQNALYRIHKKKNLPPELFRKPKWHLDFAPLPRLVNLPQDHTFSDAIEALVSAGADGSLEALAQDIKNQIAEDKVENRLKIRVSIFLPTPMANIYIDIDGRQSEGIAYDVAEGRHQNRPHGDLRQNRNLSEKTFLGLGEFLDFGDDA